MESECGTHNGNSELGIWGGAILAKSESSEELALKKLETKNPATFWIKLYWFNAFPFHRYDSSSTEVPKGRKKMPRLESRYDSEYRPVLKGISTRQSGLLPIVRVRPWPRRTVLPPRHDSSLTP